jgi:hypothetical protein
MSNTTDNTIDEAACDQLLDWSRLPVPLELKASLCARVVGRWINKISGGREETASDQATACGTFRGKIKIESGVMSLGA